VSATSRERRDNYRQNVRYIFGAIADLYYAYWGEFFHLAVFEEVTTQRTSTPP
jgi:hypothetical protein